MDQIRRIPRGEKRREEIAEVAQAVFLKLGYTDATMQVIAASAGASKETLYRHFGSKEELFSEIVRTRAGRVFSGLGEVLSSGEPKEFLVQFGNNLLRLLSSEDSLCFYRLVIAEMSRAPEIGPIFFEQGPALVLRQTTARIEAAVQSGHLNCPDPELAARLFIGSLVGNRHLHTLIAPQIESLSEAKIGPHVEEAVAMFLARYSVSPSKG
jgi:TetR/AcrR family transcriptional regulator, mexJK operon transcriptional repressor